MWSASGAFNRLCERWLGRGAALGATLLLATQPVIWGHAFISPKDLPFLTFFVLTMVAGFQLVDSTAMPTLDELGQGTRRRLLILTAAWAILVFGILESTPLVNAWIQNLVTAAAGGQSNILARVASDIRTANPDLYVQKFFVLYLRARAVLVLASAVGVALLWRKAPSAFRFVLSVAPAAILLGVTTSIRILGPFAGLMVCAYAFWKSGRKALPLVVVYIVIAAAATYATWPYLWPNPVGHFVESATLMARYPWRGQVLFDGALYPKHPAAADLPPCLARNSADRATVDPVRSRSGDHRASEPRTEAAQPWGSCPSRWRGSSCRCWYSSSRALPCMTISARRSSSCRRYLLCQVLCLRKFGLFPCRWP